QAIAVFATEDAACAIEESAPEDAALRDALRREDDTPGYVCIPQGEPLPQDSAPVAIGFGRNAGALFTVSGDGNLHRWEVATGKLAASITIGDMIERARVSPDGNWLAAAVVKRDPFRRSVEVWDLQQASRACEMDFGNSILDLDISDGGELVAVAMSDQTVTLWETKTGRTLARFDDLYNGGGSAANHVRFSPDGQRLANTCAGQLRWLTVGGRSEPVRKTATYHAPVQFFPDGTRLAMAEDRMRVLDAATGDLLYSFDPAGREWLEFSPDGRLLALTSRGDVAAELVSAASGKRIADLPNGRGPNAAFSSDGKLLAMTTVDHALQPGSIFVTVWRLAPQRP
ncbi:MAG: hypothetical protein KY475_27735, partial [Planctomycetes bacterium]|nr:hypothetical protein [Planctomycetota bacterium]